ncbi:MAG: acetylxylan esterase [Clostridia bacterium]|nr:acetylxylan esterase [Clostridia bacterium]
MNYFDLYPKAEQVDKFMEEIKSLSDGTKFNTSASSVINLEKQDFYGFHSYWEDKMITFDCEGELSKFYAIFQPAKLKHDAPLLVNLPGYGFETEYCNEIVFEGFNVLTVMPLGYNTPEGRKREIRDGEYGTWPVLPETLATGTKKGYRQYLAQAMLATKWALNQKGVSSDRVSFFGTSNGGGTALLMGSLMNDICSCVAADVPFLVNFPKSDFNHAFSYGASAMNFVSKEDAYKAAGYIDVLSHVHRLKFPVLLTAGTNDTSCPWENIYPLFEKLTETKCFMSLKGEGHRYTREFIHLAKSWFRMYA